MKRGHGLLPIENIIIVMDGIIEETAFSHPYLYLFLFSFLLSIGLSYITLTQSKANKQYTQYFILFLCVNGFWSLSLALNILLVPTIIVGISLELIVYTVFPFVSLFWFLFVYHYTNIKMSKKYIWIASVITTGLTIVSLYTIVTRWDTVDIFTETNGVRIIGISYEYFLVTEILVLVGFILSFSGTGILIYSARKQSDMNRKQYYLIILSGVILLSSATISILSIDPYSNIQIYPALFSVFVIVIWKAIYGYDFFTVIPVARTKIVETLPQSIIVVDVDENIIDMNTSAEELTNKPLDKLYKTSIYEHFDDLENEFASLKKNTKIKKYTVERDDEKKHYQVTVTPFTDNSDSYAGSIISFKDVTQLKNQKNLLEDRQEELKMQKHDLEDKTIELERQNEQLEQFASVLSHDLRNPLNVAEGYAELVKNNPENDTYYENLKTGLRRMDEMIEDLLTLTRQGKAVKSTETVDLEEQVNDSWGMLELTDSNLTVVETMDFEADKKRLKNVFENLFRNSEDHSPEGISVEIEVGVLEDSNGFYIEDNGPGVPDNHKDTIFDHGKTYSDDGTGLGLSIVDQICEAHGWEIEIKDGKSLGGARFEITTNKKSADKN